MKKKFFIFVLFIFASLAGSFYASYVNHSTKQAKAAPQKVKGYLWSDNIGWVSLSCENMAPCGVNTYQVEVESATGELSGMAWSNNIGWLNFDAGCPPGTDPLTTCSAKMVGNTIEGWAQFVSAAATPGWNGWVSFSSLNDNDPDTSGIQTAPLYGPIVSGNTLSGFAWGSTGVGWLELVDVTIEVININTNLHLIPSTSSSLTQPDVVLLTPAGAATPTLTLPAPGNFELYWYTTDPSVTYTSCDATSTSTSTWTTFTPLIPVPLDPAMSKQANVNYTTAPLQKYMLKCYRLGGGVDHAEAVVNGGNNLELRASLTTLTAANAQTAPNPLSVPIGTTNVDLYWWKTPGAPTYTSCTASSSGTSFNGPLTWPTYAPPLLPPNNPATWTYTYSGTSKTYTLTCDIQGGGTDTATAVVQSGPQCNVLNFGWTGPLCPPGSPVYVPPEISWSTSNASSCNDSPNGWQTDPLNNNNISGSDDVSSYSPGTTFNMTCNGINGGTCSPSSPLTLNYLSASDPICQQAVTQCSDGIDNDGDGFVDFAPGTWTPAYAASLTPAVDPGCVSATDNSEFNLKVKVKEN